MRPRVEYLQVAYGISERRACQVLTLPRRKGRQPEATMRFETDPGEQAQVDWSSVSYIGEDGKKRRIWIFVMTLGWSRASYVKLVRRADTAAFIQCHVGASTTTPGR